MKHVLLFGLMLASFLSYSQYPTSGVKQRLGWQTTGDGLVYRGAIADTSTLDPSGLNNAWMLLDTVSGNLYAYRIKAWRLVSGGGGGGGLTMPFDSVTFNVNETDASLRELKYSEEKGYLQYGGQDSVQIPLLPGIWYVRNDTSVTIPKGTVVRATGTLGASGRIKVKHMIANGSIDAMYILGIAMQDIAVGADGYAMSQGKIRKINTQAYSEGAVLYADVDTLGGLTQTEPTGSNLKLPIAFVVNSASNGTIAVRVTSGAYMRDLHDTYITSPDSSASLYYNKSEGIWRDTGAAVLVADTAAMLTNYINVVDTAAMLTNYINVADTATMLSSYISNADTSVFARDFQISGTTNRLAMFTGSNTVGNSWFSQSDSVMALNDAKKMQLYGRNGRRNYLEIFRNGTNTMQTNYVLATDTAYTASTGTTSRIYTHAVDNQNADYMISTYSGGGTGGFILLDAVRTGIGTTTPAYRLDVNGDVNTTGMYKKSGTDIISGTTNYLAKFTGANTVGNSVIQDNGNIGISAAPSSFKLDINGSTHTTGDFYADRAARSASAGFVSAQTNNRWLAGMISNSGSWHVYDLLRSTSVMTLDSATGNVGINTTTPTAKLHINNPNSTTSALNIVSNSNVIGSTNDAVRIDMTAAQVNQTNYGIRIVNGGFPSNEGNAIGVQSVVNARNTSYGLVGSASKNWGGASLFGDAIGVYGSGTTDSPAGFSYGGYFKNDTTQGTGFGVFIQTTTPKGSGTVTPLAIQHNSTELMRVQSSGNVGIATASPSRPLHVAGTTAIRIPSGNFSQRGTSDNGDIRIRTDTASMEYYSGAWRTIAPMARVPQSGLANRFSKFDANGLLDTSAILIQANNRIGIFNSPAAGDSALTVTGGIRTTTSIRTGSDATINGIRVGRGGGNHNTSVAIGLNALNSANSFGFNVAIGNEALMDQTSGYYNIAIGPQALKSNTDQSNLVAIGLQALEKNSTGYYNVAVGSNVLGKNTSGNNNAGFGYQALFENTTGTYNLALGAAPLYSNTTGSYNIALGSEALRNGTTGSYNAALGTKALFETTIGYNNFALGPFALEKNTTGYGNIAVGFEAGRLTNSSASNQTSAYCTYIGYDSRGSSSGNTGEVVIGYQGRGNGSNTTTIGNSSTTHTVFQYGETLLGYSATQDKGAFRLQVEGEGYVSTGFRVDYLGAFDANTIFQMPNTSTKGAKGYAWNTYSDARIKTSVSDIENALEKTMALRPVRYLQSDSYVENGQIKVSDTGRNTIGFIAQEVEPIVPEAVQRGSDTELWGMDYTKLIPMLTKAIQEQQAQIEALKKEIEQLKNK